MGMLVAHYFLNILYGTNKLNMGGYLFSSKSMVQKIIGSNSQLFLLYLLSVLAHRNMFGVKSWETAWNLGRNKAFEVRQT